MVDPRANWKRLEWDLHSSAGFWTFAIVFMWAFTGIYLVFPDPFQRGLIISRRWIFTRLST